jgi:hypothetical protein
MKGTSCKRGDDKYIKFAVGRSESMSLLGINLKETE